GPVRLIADVADLAADTCLSPYGEIVSGRDSASGRRGIGRVLAGAIVGLKSSGPDRCLDVGRVRFVRQVTEGAAAVQVAVRVGIGDGVRASGGQHGVLQAERSEQTALETTGQRLPLHLFCDAAEQRVLGVSVMK